jgi:very-short-patch-repair endonuclease
LPDLARLARITRRSSQRGHFTVAQASRCGINRQMLFDWAGRGILTRTGRGVYRFAAAGPTTWKDDLAGSLLATGGTASGRSAVALYGLIGPPARSEVLVHRKSRHAISPQHTTRTSPKRDYTVVDGLRALHPVRAILDAAHRMPRKQAVDMIERAIVRGLIDPLELERRARELRNSKRPGCRVVLGILAELHPELERSRNEWEALVVRRCRELGLPEPELEYEIWIDGEHYFLDAAWPDLLVTLEFDGRDPHMRRHVHDHDSRRRNDLAAAGWTRFGITSTDARRTDAKVFRQVAQALRGPAIVRHS